MRPQGRRRPATGSAASPSWRSALATALVFIHAAAAAGVEVLTEQHPRVYVAELPSKYNVDIIYTPGKPGCDLPVEDILASPLGRLDSGHSLEGLRRTAYFGLEWHVHMELLQSPLRVMNASEADLVYVPFYVVNLANTHSRDSCGRPLSHEEAEAVVRDFWAEAPALLPLLGRVPHWMMLAQLQLETMDGCADVDLRGWGVSFTCHPGFAHLTVGVPEPFSGRSEAARHDRLLSAVPHFPNTLAVPYLGHVHHGPRDYAAAFDPGGLAAGKAARAAMVFTATRKTQLRPALLRQCAAHPGQCTAPEFPRDRVGDALAGMVEAYAHAWHCVQPWGDTPTRLAFYECAATGAALPVVFDPRLPDFLAFADLVDYRAFVTVLDPQAFISGEQDIVQVLSAPSPQDMLARLERLHRVRHVMQYAVRPQHLLVRFDERETVHAGDDAFTASFKAALRNLCRRGLLPDKCLQTGAA